MPARGPKISIRLRSKVPTRQNEYFNAMQAAKDRMQICKSTSTFVDLTFGPTTSHHDKSALHSSPKSNVASRPTNDGRQKKPLRSTRSRPLYRIVFLIKSLQVQARPTPALHRGRPLSITFSAARLFSTRFDLFGRIFMFVSL